MPLAESLRPLIYAAGLYGGLYERRRRARCPHFTIENVYWVTFYHGTESAQNERRARRAAHQRGVPEDGADHDPVHRRYTTLLVY